MNYVTSGYIGQWTEFHDITSGSKPTLLLLARFSAPVQIGPGAHLASYTMGSGPFLVVKLPGCGFDHPTPSSTEVKEIRTGLRRLF